MFQHEYIFFDTYIREFLVNNNRSVAFFVTYMCKELRIPALAYTNENYMNEGLKILLVRQPKYQMSNFTAFSLTFLLKNVVL